MSSRPMKAATFRTVASWFARISSKNRNRTRGSCRASHQSQRSFSPRLAPEGPKWPPAHASSGISSLEKPNIGARNRQLETQTSHWSRKQ